MDSHKTIITTWLQKVISFNVTYVSRQPLVLNLVGRLKTLQISQPHSSLSVVVPASYEEPPSLPTSPLPPTTDPIIPETEMGSGATKFLTESKRNDVTASSNGQSMTSQETDIQCVVEMTDGKKKPAAIDFGVADVSSGQQKSTDTIICNYQAEAEAKRLELKTLLLEYEQLVVEVQRLELYKLNNRHRP
nr:uncharacterized protein LOC113474685 [Ciona intestinalis]|eukprot:XP_026692554.1 uncharacterized protein LOC113474685 [Ciona intestinalis]